MAAGDIHTMLLGGVEISTVEQADGSNVLKTADVSGGGGSGVTAATDSGPTQTIVQTNTISADMTTAAAITPAPTAGLTLVATDILVSSDTAMSFTIQMETSAAVLARVYLAAGSTASITLRGYLAANAINKKMFGKASVSGNVSITANTFSK